MAIVYLGLGSNLGNREQNLRQALTALNEQNIYIRKVSSFIETEPEGGPPQGKFINAVAEVSTEIPPLELMHRIQSIEFQLGRKRTESNGPRTLDIDILLYDQIIVNTPELTIPHPRLWQRDFVLIPLHEIAPHLVKEARHARH